MIFIHKIKTATSEEWGICTKCKQAPPISMLCSTCLDKRSNHFHKQLEERNSSWEYRIRQWVANLFDPTKSKRYQ